MQKFGEKSIFDKWLQMLRGKNGQIQEVKVGDQIKKRQIWIWAIEDFEETARTFLQMKFKIKSHYYTFQRSNCVIASHKYEKCWECSYGAF